jgi:hypothetical protein
MFDAFMDESHDGGAYCVAGFLGQPLGWDRLWARWSKMLDDAGVQVFHAADCEGGYGEFANMSREQREALQRRAIELISGKDIRVMGVVAGVEVEPYTRLRPHLEKYRRFLPGQRANR